MPAAYKKRITRKKGERKMEFEMLHNPIGAFRRKAVYSYEEETRGDLAKLSPREQENYIARLCGEDTIDNLREAFNKLFFKTQVYEQVLRSNGLLSKAERELKTAEEEPIKQALQFREWRLANPNEELPFD